LKEKLIVIEGPDSIGKTVICKTLSNQLNNLQISNTTLSFPGNRKGTIGKFIHDFHHKHDKYGIKKLSPNSLQLLHVAAHFDTISEEIMPALERGKIVLLDRFWWSTYVYGKVSGIRDEILNKILELEDLAWDGLKPNHIFLINNREPINAPKTEEWEALRVEYIELAKRHGKLFNISYLENKSSIKIEETTKKIIDILGLN
jgi:thymidylate kinase